MTTGERRSTADRILVTAMAEFGTRGYEATSLDDLARLLGIRKQTILYWFPSKELLLEAVKQNVAFVPGASFHPDGSGANTMRLNFSNASEPMIEEGIARLGRVVRASIARGASPEAAAVR